MNALFLEKRTFYNTTALIELEFKISFNIEGGDAILIQKLQNFCLLVQFFRKERIIRSLRFFDNFVR